jgi:hypothetical protein
VQGIADVRNGNAAFDIRFAAGTFDPASTRVTIQLDIDQLESTGIRTVYGLGIDYTVDMWAATRRALVLRAVPSGSCTSSSPCYVEAGSAPLTLQDDGMKVVVPLSLLGQSNGRLNFRVLAYAMRPGTAAVLPTTVSDFMPDVALPPVRLQ